MKRFLTIILAFSLLLASSVMGACGAAEEKTVYVKYYADASNMLPALKQGAIEIGLVPEPAASKLENVLANDKTWYRLDVQELYDGTSSYPQAALMIKQSVSATFSGVVNELSAAITLSAEWVKQNPADAVNAVNGALEEGVTPSLSAGAITANVVKNCKIYWQSAADAKTAVKNYIDDIIAVGDALSVPPAIKVNDEFFLSGNETGVFEGDKLTVCVPDGAPALAIAKLINDSDDLGTGKTVEYKVVAADKIGAFITQGKADIVVMPVNAASKTYNKYTADTYKMAAVITHGNLYIMSAEKIEIDDLDGKTIGVIGQGNVPDLTFRAIMKDRNIKVEIAA